MGTIYIVNNMFIKTKNVFVVVGKEVKENIEVIPDLLNTTLLELIKKYNCNEIKIKGIPIYCKKLQAQITTFILKEFDNKDIKVSIIQKEEK